MNPPTLLVAEDEAIVAADLAEKLTLLGYKVIATTGRGDEAVTLALSLKPDLVLMDIRLQGPMDGIAAAQQIRAEGNIPIVFLTAHSEPSTLEHAKLTEPFGYLLKPFEERELHTAVEIALYKHQAECRLRESEQRYRSLFVYSLDAIFSLDAEGRFISANPAAERLSGYTQEELKQRHFLELCVPELRDAAKSAFRDAFCRHCRDIESAVIRRDGTRRDLFITGAPVVVDGEVVGISCLARDITERKASERALRESEARLKAIVETAIDGIITIDEHGTIESVNAAIERMFGYPAAEIVGRNVAELMPEPHRTKHNGYLARYLETGEKKIIGIGRELRGRRRDGNEFAMELGVTETHLDNRRFFTGLIRDITERKALENKLIEASRKKDEFIATLAHELRNPLGPIRNAVMILGKQGLDERHMASSREIIERQIGQMARLLDDLLDISRITCGKLTLCSERVELATLLEQAAETARPLIDANGHEFIVELPPQSIWLEGDSMRLAQVFSNLLTNAAKYSEKGGRIHLEARQRGGEIAVSVKDNGIGIAADHLPRVFEMFSQVESALDRSHGGLGIGLSLVKGLIELHRGRITAHSEGLNRGSEFVVYLPVAETPEMELELSDTEGKPADAGKYRILVVDDNVDGTASLALMLQLNGHDIRTAYDGLEAVQAAQAFRPDVILMDIGMPKLNGYDACRRIRAQPWGKRMILVALTGWGQDKDRQKSQEAGFDYHFVKPVDPAALINLLAGLKEAFPALRDIRPT